MNAKLPPRLASGVTAFASVLAPALAVAFALGVISPALSAEPHLPRDGWASWEVPSSAGSPFWCCWSQWTESSASAEPCRLDSRSSGFGTRGAHDPTETVKIYVRTSAGTIDRVQPLAATCPVETKTPVNQLQGISADDSVRWLASQARREGRDAVTGEPLAEMALAALSLLLEDRAVKSLIALAEDRSLPREQRKRAVFWLSQSERDSALAYLERVLAGARR